jgi:site-specific DNA-methyltransferase (adenine-specific)
MAKRATTTSAFGVSRRESHDASGFYRRFTTPDLSEDHEVAADRAIDRLIIGDAREMSEVPDSSVALVVTSPPYFAGKQYEEDLDKAGIPSNYIEYLELLRDVFAECVRKLEPGGRIAVNVANLGRRPFRSLSADVTSILQDDLRLLLRGEIVWVKQRGSAGSCAWGSFQKASNPVLRDLTERVIIASKGRFDRALATKERERLGLPFSSSMTREDFMENTLDVWEIPPESATRIGHPAPFPLELPERLIQLYTYRSDLVLDPFLGAGTTAVAALRHNRHFVGYDLDSSYIDLARLRVEQEQARIVADRDRADAEPTSNSEVTSLKAQGRSAKELALALLEDSGLEIIETGVKFPGGVEIDFATKSAGGGRVLVEVAGSFTSARGGLARSETVWRTIAKAAVVRANTSDPLVVISSELPPTRSAIAEALRQVTGVAGPILSVLDVFDPHATEALRQIAKNNPV